jgi:uncharacterized membrane protein
MYCCVCRRLGDSGVAFPKGAAKVVAEGDVPLSDEDDDEAAAAAAADKQQQQQRPLHPDEELEQQQAAEAAEAAAAAAAEHSDDEPEHRPEGALRQGCILGPAFCCWLECAALFFCSAWDLNVLLYLAISNSAASLSASPEPYLGAADYLSCPSMLHMHAMHIRALC